MTQNKIGFSKLTKEEKINWRRVAEPAHRQAEA